MWKALLRRVAPAADILAVLQQFHPSSGCSPFPVGAYAFCLCTGMCVCVYVYVCYQQTGTKLLCSA